MAIAHAKPGDVIEVGPLGDALPQTQTSTLFKTEHVEVIRMVMRAGRGISEHKAPGEIVVQCLEGKVVFTVSGESTELAAGQMLYLGAGAPHAVRCIDDASFLLTLVLRA